MAWLHRFISYVIVRLQREMAPMTLGYVLCFPGHARDSISEGGGAAIAVWASIASEFRWAVAQDS